MKSYWKDYWLGARPVLLCWLLAYALVACAQLGLVGPQTPEQRVAAGYATAEAVNRTATQLLNAKKISSVDGQNVLNTTRAARQGLDVARSLTKIDPKSATAKIEAQQAILKALQEYLATRGGK
jgi:hypothetical protein